MEAIHYELRVQIQLYEGSNMSCVAVASEAVLSLQGDAKVSNIAILSKQDD